MTRAAASACSSPSSIQPGNIGCSGRERAGVPPSRASRRSRLVSVTRSILDIEEGQCNTAGSLLMRRACSYTRAMDADALAAVEFPAVVDVVDAPRETPDGETLHLE